MNCVAKLVVRRLLETDDDLDTGLGKEVDYPLSKEDAEVLRRSNKAEIAKEEAKEFKERIAVQNAKRNAYVLTTPGYWSRCPESVKSMWQSVAEQMFQDGTVVCTHRPSLLRHRGNQKVRRCSTGGKFGKSADLVYLNLESLRAEGYVWRRYTPASVRLASKLDVVYSDDRH